MKIIIVSSFLVGGGAERVATIWANSFVALGHKVILASNLEITDAPFVYPIHEKVVLAKCFGLHNKTPMGWKALVLRKTPRLYNFFKSVANLITTHFLLRKTIKTFKPDIIIGLVEPTPLRVLIASIGTGCPVIATEHDSFERPDCAPFKVSEKFFKFVVNKCFAAVTVLTEADRLYIGSRLKNVYVMPNPLPFAPITVHTKREKRIVAAGRLQAWHCKGFDVLIKAWGKIAYKYPDWIVDIAGEAIKKANEAIPYLERLIEENGVTGRCILSGFHSNISQLYSQSEIFVLSSRYEGFGMVLLEAMSQGCACIACDYKGRQREIIRNDDEGLCIPTENVDKLSEALEKMINDEKYRERVQLNAPKRAADYSAIAIAHKWEELFNIVKEKKY
ncbi:MAG: glycosyltransferase family 4 protein [Prevotella sp.]|nr:glycosyltransferase family 4 protein [Prevotella sp.]